MGAAVLVVAGARLSAAGRRSARRMISGTELASVDVVYGGRVARPKACTGATVAPLRAAMSPATSDASTGAPQLGHSAAVADVW